MWGKYSRNFFSSFGLNEGVLKGAGCTEFCKVSVRSKVLGPKGNYRASHPCFYEHVSFYQPWNFLNEIIKSN